MMATKETRYYKYIPDPDYHHPHAVKRVECTADDPEMSIVILSNGRKFAPMNEVRTRAGGGG